MRKFQFIGSCLIFGFQLSINAQYNFGLLRQSDDVSFLKKKEDKTTYDNFKYVSLGERTYLSFGGSNRFQYEYFDNQNFVNGDTDGWPLNRAMLHADFRFGNNWQVYAELASSTIFSKENLSPVDRDEFALSQAFVAFRSKGWFAHLGREALRYGSRRLVAPNEGPNVRRYFDGIRTGYSKTHFSLEALYYQPVAVVPYGFDNEALDGDEYLTGVYGTFENNKKTFGLDAYYLFQKQARGVYEAGISEEHRSSFGLRHFGNIGNFFFDNEGVFQWGAFGNGNIQAWTLSTKLNYIIPVGENRWDFELKAEIITGDDDPTDNELNAFNALYPRGAYFGRVAQFGPSNLIDIHPAVTYFMGNWFFNFDYVSFWRESTQDAVYGAGLNLAFPDVNDASFIGHQFGAVINWQVNTFFTLELESNYILPGDFLKESSLDNKLLHIVFTSELKF